MSGGYFPGEFINVGPDNEFPVQARPKKVYIIGSLRNPGVQKVAQQLRVAFPDIVIFDDWACAGEHADDACERVLGVSKNELVKGNSAQPLFADTRNTFRHMERHHHRPDYGDVSMNEQLYKADAGKRRPTLIQVGFAKAIRLVQATMEYGGIKYEAHSWRNVPNARERYFEAAERHRQDRMMAVQRGMGHTDALDDESNLPHIAHEIFNLMALIELDYGLMLPDIEAYCAFNMPPADHKIPTEYSASTVDRL